MAKGETFGDIFPEGICGICRKEIVDVEGAIIHYECAIAYEDIRKEKMKDDM